MKKLAVTQAILLLTICSALLLSCEADIVHNGKTPLVSVGNEFLYVEDVNRFYNANPHITDSAQYVDEFINRWVEEAVFYEVARRNVPSSQEIDNLVESYKRSLVLNVYQEGLVEQHLRTEISIDDVQAFYDANKQMFEIEEPVMRGIFLRVKRDAPKMSSLRKWYKSRAIEDLEKLEKYSVTNDVEYDYFAEDWKQVSDIAAKTPIGEEELLSRLSRNKAIEFNDKENVYFLSVDSLVVAGSLKPLELVEAEIRELLINTMKANFIKSKKHVLHEEAVKSGKIIHYNK